MGTQDIPVTVSIGIATDVDSSPIELLRDASTAMHRAKFRLDALLEPAAGTTGPRGPQWTELLRWAPPTLLLRGRKEGI